MESNPKKCRTGVNANSDDEPSLIKARKLYESAKQKWLYPERISDLEIEVQSLLRTSIKNTAQLLEKEIDDDDEYESCYELNTQAREALTLISIQKTDYDRKGAYRLLRDGGFIARLSQDVLGYEIPIPSCDTTVDGQSSSAAVCPCRVYDDALPREALDTLIGTLCPENASYWKDHSYSVHPSPSPYFSYAFDLRDETIKELGVLGELVETVRRLSSGLLATLNDDDNDDESAGLEPTPRFAEIWAHHRPHSSGHQLHFDSDNEGQGEVKHPLISSILYLSEEGCGGPSLMTDQRLGDTDLAQNGWLAFPKRNRLVVFDGSVLHGVIPGRGYVEGERKRVTLMIALWEDIRIRKGHQPGAARPLPLAKAQEDVNGNICPGAPVPKWCKSLTLSSKGGEKNCNQNLKADNGMVKEVESRIKHTPKKVKPVQLGCVFSTINGKPIRKGQMPHYETVFQGF